MRLLKANGEDLRLSEVAREYLESFKRSDNISERAVQHVIDVATTAAMLDKRDQVETEHIIEAMQCRLVDRMTWVTSVSDKSILDFLATHNSKNRSKSKFDSWITTTSVP